MSRSTAAARLAAIAAVATVATAQQQSEGTLADCPRCGLGYATFDGQGNEGIAVPNTNNMFSLTSGWTLKATVRARGTLTQLRPVIWKVARCGLNEDTMLLGVGPTGARAGLERRSDGRDYSAGSGPIQGISSWTTIMGTYSQASGFLRVYVNGDLAGSTQIGSQTAYTGPCPLYIGDLHHTNHGIRGDWFGDISNVSVWNRAFEDGLGASNLLLHYEFKHAARSASRCCTDSAGGGSGAATVLPGTTFGSWCPNEYPSWISNCTEPTQAPTFAPTSAPTFDIATVSMQVAATSSVVAVQSSTLASTQTAMSQQIASLAASAAAQATCCGANSAAVSAVSASASASVASVAASVAQLSTAHSLLRSAIQNAVSGVPAPGSGNTAVGQQQITSDHSGMRINAMGGDITLRANGVAVRVADLLAALNSLRSV